MVTCALAYHTYLTAFLHSVLSTECQQCTVNKVRAQAPRSLCLGGKGPAAQTQNRPLLHRAVSGRVEPAASLRPCAPRGSVCT